MSQLLDGVMMRGYIKSYIICFVSLLSLYIVVDLFMNVNDFAHTNDNMSSFLGHVGAYYVARSTTIFDRLSEMIVLLAAMFTIALMQRNNELLPQLSAGVSTQRVVRPVLISACAMITFATLNQELIIPQFSHMLVLGRDDPRGEQELPVHRGDEPNGTSIWSTKTAVRKDLLVREFRCDLRIPSAPGKLIILTAKEARYVPPTSDNKPRTGGWMLTEATSSASMIGWKDTDILEPIPPQVSPKDPPTKFFLKTQEVDFDVLTRDQRKWFFLTSTWKLFQELGKHDAERASSLAVIFHMRLTRPILGMVLVIMGLSVILRDQNRNVFISAGMCLIIGALFFATCFACQQLGDKSHVSPALAAWLPVILFGPLSFVMFDAIHT